MSQNLSCYIKVGSLLLEEVVLIQTTTKETAQILGPPGHPWKDIASSYLAWVKTELTPSLNSRNPVIRDDARGYLKRERKRLGEAWQKAEELGGSLCFRAT